MERRSFIKRVLGILALPFVGKPVLDAADHTWSAIGPATEFEVHWAEVYNAKTGQTVAWWNSLHDKWHFPDGSTGDYVTSGPDDSVRCSWGPEYPEFCNIKAPNEEIRIEGPAVRFDEINQNAGMTRALGARPVNPVKTSTARTRRQRVRAFLSGTP